MNKWVERAAIITGTLGMIGVLIVFFITVNERLESDDKNESIANEIVENKTAANVFTIKENNVKSKVLLDKVETKIENVVEAEPKKVKDEKPKKEIQPPVKEEIKKTKKITEKAKEKIVKPVITKLEKEPKLLSPEQLSDVAGAIKARNRYSGNTSNCVRIQAVRSANSTKAIAQVSKYLRSRKITITGREIILNGRKGIYIKPSGDCITVVIGHL